MDGTAFHNGVAAALCLCSLACTNPRASPQRARLTGERFASADGRVSGVAPEASQVAVVASGVGYQLTLRGQGLDVTCYLTAGRDRPLSTALFEAASLRLGADLKASHAEGRIELRFATESDRPIQYAIVASRPLLFWPVTLTTDRLPPRQVDLAAAMLPGSTVACHSNRAGHDARLVEVLSALAEKLAVDLPSREAIPHYTEAELVRFDGGDIGLRQVLVHRIPGGLFTTFYESVSRRSGVSDRTIYEVSGDDGQIVRSHFIFYRDGKRQLRVVLERTGATEYSVTDEDESGKISPPRTLRSGSPLLARMTMALELRDAEPSALPADLPDYELFAPEASEEALVTIRISKPGPESAAPQGMKQIASSATTVDAGSLSLSRAYGYPAMVELAAPPSVTGALGK
jgi:hypothetical protein